MILLTRLRSFFNLITSSIAFYPTLYAVTAIVFGMLMKIAEARGITSFLQENMSALVVNDLDTARNVLTTLIAGGLSMLVFSFSMVMLLLSQAAANYSPRVLPSLISNRKHQTILGIFLATILYNIITAIGIEPTGENYQMPGFSVLLGIISAILALGAFVYFIHSISTSIQINNILRNIFSLSRKRLDQLVEKDNTQTDFPDTKDWYVYKTKKSGTIQNISIKAIVDLANKTNSRFEIPIIKGTFIHANEPLLLSEKELNEDETNELYKNFNYSESELVSDNYVLGFKQISEIGIKAMSPGINDPGTALDTIQYLTELLKIRMQKSDEDLIENEEEKIVVRLWSTRFQVLLYNIMVAYRTYCKHDMTVMQRLLGMLCYLYKQDALKDSYHKDIALEAKTLMTDAKEAISNERDLEVLEQIFKKSSFDS